MASPDPTRLARLARLRCHLRGPRRLAHAGALGACLVLAACGVSPRRVPGDEAPTLKTLAGQRHALPADPGIPADEERAIDAYRRFLDAAPNAPQRAQAMRRLGDLAMDAADQRAAAASSAVPADPDYRAAIARYQEYLKAFPQAADTDRVLYQLARAQEQGGQLEAALQTLDRLVTAHPRTRHLDEAQFRRGELLFTARQYAQAERAYAQVLAQPDSALRERALYMQGWAVFKQGRLEDALTAFFAVLDLKLGQASPAAELEDIPGLGRADRELVEDTFRVVSLSLENLQGAASIPAYVDGAPRQAYEVHVYRQLAGLYLRQDRPKDAADTLGAFVRRQPAHAQAPALQARVIEIHQQAGFASLALQAKREYVARYGADSGFRRDNPEAWSRSQPLLKTHLTELAAHHHAAAQKTRSAAEVQEAVRWYRAWLDAFPEAPEAPRQHFLLAELLYEDRQFGPAAAEYEIAAYRVPGQPHGADAGYAALLAQAGQDGRLRAEGRSAELAALQAARVDSALRFAQAFPADARVPAVLTDLAERLYALQRGEQAGEVAQRVIDMAPPAPAALRRVAWTVQAHTAFEAGRFERAEAAYGQVLALAPAGDAARGELNERLAAAIYRQGEQARDAGRTQDAAAHFARVASAAPDSTVRTAAQFDAAAAQVVLRDWAGAATTLEDFRRRFPRHPLAGQVPERLALAYTELGRWAEAAAEYERVAAAQQDPALARSALWQAAQLHDKAADEAGPAGRAAAARAWERYLRQHPAPLEPALDARHRLALLAEAEGQLARALAWRREIVQAELAGGAERSAHTRTVAALSALALAEPLRAGYAEVRLVEPLQRQLQRKKARLEDALKAYAAAAEYGVAEVTTAATFHTAALYQDFGRALLGSERPRKLGKLEREQYDVLLEEQAFPFEEKAIELHALNARRAGEGMYDQWVKQSFAALRTLQPARWGRQERVDGPEDAGHAEAAALNRQAVQWREQGEFARARAAYEQAIATDPAYAPATLNLGVLFDLYLGQPQQALALYERYLAGRPEGDAVVARWVAELSKRRPAAASPAAPPAAPSATAQEPSR